MAVGNLHGPVVKPGLFYDIEGTDVTAAAYTEIEDALTHAVSHIQVYNGSAQVLILAIGAAASEVDQLYLPIGLSGMIPISLAKGARLAVKSTVATANSGRLAINLFG